MVSFQITTSILGIGLAMLIIFLLRQDHLYIGFGFFWIFVAFLALIFGFWPGLADRMAIYLGINYPPAFILLISNIILFIKALRSDLSHTELERQVRILNQKIAIIEVEKNNEFSRK